MASNLKGKATLQKRMGAVAKEITTQGADRWQRRATRLAQSTLSGYDMPYSKGALRRSVKVGAIRKTGGLITEARVNMMYHGFFVDAGTQGHGLNSRMSRVMRSRRGISGEQYRTLIATSRTVFAKKARSRRGGGYEARPFRDRVAVEALKQTGLRDIAIDLWNGAA
jgi:hypothetical protein